MRRTKEHLDFLYLNKKYRPVITLFIALCLSSCAFLPPKLDLPITVNTMAELEPYLENAVLHQKPPSVSVGVIKNNNTVYTKAFGHTDALRQSPASPDTVYQWWSLTKLFTAVAVLQLQERGLLSIDDSVVDHLPGFTTRGKNVNPQDITIKQLLSHSSGLGDVGMAILGWIHFEGDTHPNQTDLFNRTVGQYNQIKVEPDAQGRYSNFGYLALAALIESVSGESYEDFILATLLA